VLIFVEFHSELGSGDYFFEGISLMVVNLSVVMVDIVNGNWFGSVSGNVILMVGFVMGLNQAEVLAVVDLGLEKEVAIFLNLTLVDVLLVVVGQGVSQLELFQTAVLLLLDLPVDGYL
jgi:hypothetical protein